MEGFLLYLVCYDVGFILYGAQAVIWLFARGAVKDRRATARVAPAEFYKKCLAGGQRHPPLRSAYR